LHQRIVATSAGAPIPGDLAGREADLVHVRRISALCGERGQ
jgi:hypothetical protein